MGRSENQGVSILIGGHNRPPPCRALVEIGLSVLQKSGVPCHGIPEDDTLDMVTYMVGQIVFSMPNGTFLYLLRRYNLVAELNNVSLQRI